MFCCCDVFTRNVWGYRDPQTCSRARPARPGSRVCRHTSCCWRCTAHPEKYLWPWPWPMRQSAPWPHNSTRWCWGWCWTGCCCRETVPPYTPIYSESLKMMIIFHTLRIVWASKTQHFVWGIKERIEWNMARILYLWYHQLDWDRNRLDKKEGGMAKRMREIKILWLPLPLTKHKRWKDNDMKRYLILCASAHVCLPLR